MLTAEMHTEKGVMKIEFYEKDAPNTVKNFVKLSKMGFYDGVIFHRVIPDFVIQVGDPTGTGAGAQDIPLSVSWMEKISIMTEVCFPWHMREEIPGGHNSLSAITG